MSHSFASTTANLAPRGRRQRGRPGTTIGLLVLESALLILVMRLVLTMAAPARAFDIDRTRAPAPMETPEPIPAPLGAGPSARWPEPHRHLSGEEPR